MSLFSGCPLPKAPKAGKDQEELKQVAEWHPQESELLFLRLPALVSLPPVLVLGY